ncbi:MAG: hypothetical protein ACSLEL_03995 [Candidatus Malihini olakiniferum]
MLIGVNLGEIKIEIIVICSNVIRHRMPTPHDDSQGTLKAIVTLVNNKAK